MSGAISELQEKYLLALKESVGEEKFEEIRKELRISQPLSVSELSKDEAYHLITKLIAESSTEEVERALATALGKDLPNKRSHSRQNDRTTQAG